MKWLGMLVLVVLLVLGGGFLWLSANLNGLVRDGIEQQAPLYLGTDVRVADVDLAPFSGTGSLSGLRVANPQGFDGDAFEFDEVRVALDLATLRAPVLVVQEVVLNGAAVLLDQRGRDTNLQRLQRHLEQATAGGADSAGRKVVVERFLFTNGTATVRSDVLGERSISIPDLELTGLGKAGEGATPAEILRQVVTPLVRSLTEAVQARALQEGRARAEEALQGELQERLGEDGARVLDALKGLGGFGGRDEDPGGG